jgi:hypothetical protein
MGIAVLAIIFERTLQKDAITRKTLMTRVFDLDQSTRVRRGWILQVQHAFEVRRS